MQKLKQLLGATPSVRRFKELISVFSEEEQKGYYHYVYDLALRPWGKCPRKYRIFFVDLIRHDRQRFLDYIHGETVLGALRHPVDDPRMFKKMCKLLSIVLTKRKFSYNHFSFSLLQSFDVRLKMSVLGDQIRTQSFYPEELLELLECVRILN
jgi:hypothetical protein